MSACRKCSRPAADPDAVPLWDGHVYCAECVEAACPGLAEYAREHDALEEVVPEGVRDWRVVPLWLRLLIAGPFFILLLFGLKHLPAFMAGLPFVGVILLPVGLGALVLAAVGLVILVERRRPGVRRVVRVCRGVVELAFGDRIERHPLDRCRWEEGGSWADFSLREFDRCPAVLLWVPGQRRIACGLTDEDYDRWVGFLELAAPRGRVAALGPFVGWKFTAGLLVGTLAAPAVHLGVLTRLESLGLIPAVPQSQWVLSTVVAGVMLGPLLSLLFALGFFARRHRHPAGRPVYPLVWLAVALPAVVLIGGTPAAPGLLPVLLALLTASGLFAGFVAWWEWRWPHPEPPPGPRRPAYGYWPHYHNDDD